jgi:DNA repair exonuclease SbcCD nuclease subunit
MKTVFISDIHLGKYKYGKINAETGLDLRTEDIMSNIDQSIDFAIKKKVNSFIIAGDFYHKKRPLPIFRKLLASKLNRLLTANIETFLLLGNHDQGKTSGHDLTELSEVGDHINNLHVIDEPQNFVIEDTNFCFLPCVNKIDYEIQEHETEFNIKTINSFASQKTKADKNIFIGHFGTDKSIAGKGFDLGMIQDQDSKHIRVVPLSTFDEKFWTRVYLGDIHKPQELNSFSRHIGSIARVDFGEEYETKGFYYYEDGKDEFIKLHDREFKSLEVNLDNDKARETMTEFCENVQDLDLSEAIVRLKITIRQSDRKMINFDFLENFLKEESWNYIGKNLLEITTDKESITLDTNDELNHIELFKKYIDLISDKIDEDLIEDVQKEGEMILAGVLNS